MSGTFFGLELGKRSLLANKMSMDVTGNNVANASTPGYSRERVQMVSETPFTVSTTPTGVFQIGTGVSVEDVLRDRDSYIDRQVRNNQSQISYWEKDKDTLTGVEALFPSPTTEGITLYLDDFFNGWQSINENPTDSGLREGMVDKGQALADMMNQTYSQLGIIKDNLGQSFTDNSAQVKLLTDQITQLNVLIDKSYATNCNVLMDERDLRLDDLSKLVQIDVSTNATNSRMVDVSISDGTKLITGVTNNFDTVLSANTIDSVDTVGLGGTMGAIKTAKTQVTDYMLKLKNLADAITKEVNGIYDNPPINTDPVIKRPDGEFFTDPPATGKIMQLKITSGDKVVVGLDDTAQGDTRIALALAQLRDKKVTSLNSDIDTYYQSLLVSIGQESKSAGQMLDTQNAVSDQLLAQRESVSGVNTDEEMTNLMKYQVGYQASAKIISTVNNMFDVLFAMVS